MRYLDVTQLLRGLQNYMPRRCPRCGRHGLLRHQCPCRFSFPFGVIGMPMQIKTA